MDKKVFDFVEYIVNDAPKKNKQKVIDDVVNKFSLIKDRTVYYCSFFAVRFCYSKSNSFSNTVLSLSHLQKYDSIPFFVVLVKLNGDNVIYLANATFLSKVSHSSKELSMQNIKGSFNGSDILKIYQDIPNKPDNFRFLFAIHEGLSWTDNLHRLVEASSNVVSRVEKYNPIAEDLNNIFTSIDRAKQFIQSNNFDVLCNDLNDRCASVKKEICIASKIENTNIRGRLIEMLITSDEKERERLTFALVKAEESLPIYDTRNDLGDYCRNFDNGETYTDIKTKVVYLDSNPKAFNIDKFLRCMSKNNTIFFFFFVGIDEKGIMNTILASVYHKELLENTILQHHWAGRSSRGVAQYNGKVIDGMLREDKFVNDIDSSCAKNFLENLLKR